MADRTSKLSPLIQARKKRSVQFVVDSEGGVNALGHAQGEGSGYSSSHEGDNISLRSADSSSRANLPRSASPLYFPLAEVDGIPISVCRPTDAPENLAIFEISLGLLTQHTIYQVQFLLPAAGRLSTPEAEVIRSDVVVPEEGKSFQRSAIIEVESIEYIKADDAYLLNLKLSTTSARHLFEGFALRNSNDYDQYVQFIIKGQALGKGRGTPSLRQGIHRIAHTPEYQESDAKTEWTGFNDPEPVE